MTQPTGLLCAAIGKKKNSGTLNQSYPIYFMDYALFAGFAVLIVVLVYAIIRMGKNSIKGKDDLW